jgi:hypothetical protein
LGYICLEFYYIWRPVVIFTVAVHSLYRLPGGYHSAVLYISVLFSSPSACSMPYTCLLQCLPSCLHVVLSLPGRWEVPGLMFLGYTFLFDTLHLIPEEQEVHATVHSPSSIYYFALLFWSKFSSRKDVW